MRDSKVSFTLDAALGMLVHLHKAKKGGDDAKERVQSMQSYGMQDWNEWKGFVAPEACLMEHRVRDADAGELFLIPCKPAGDCMWPDHMALTDLAPSQGLCAHATSAVQHGAQVCCAFHLQLTGHGR